MALDPYVDFIADMVRSGNTYRDINNHLQHVGRGSSEANIRKFCGEVGINPRSESLTDTQLEIVVETAVDEILFIVNILDTYKKLIARKRCLWRYHKRDVGNQVMAAQYKMVARECKDAMRDVELLREKRVIDADNSGQFFKYVNSKLNRPYSIGISKENSVIMP